MKKILSFCTLMTVVSLAVLLSSCKDEPEIVPEVVTPNVAVAFNTTSFLPGDVLTVTLTEDSGAEDREDIPLYFSVTDSETGLSADNLFTDFTYTATLASTASQISVSYTVIDDIEENYNLNFVIEADDCTVAGGSQYSQPITVGTAYVVTLAVTDSEDGTVTEGSTFTFTAATPVAPETDLTIDLTYDSGAEAYFDALPETVVIPAGQTEGQTAEITVTADGGDYQADYSFEVSGVSQSAHYAVANTLTVTRKDRDNYLYDETWVYSDPAQTFVSNDLLEKYNSYGNNADYVVMTKATDGTGSPHPNADLAAEGWTLLNSTEFSYIPEGMYYPCFSANEYGNNYISFQNGWAEESTTSMQEHSYLSYEKFTNVTEEGYLRIWSAYDEGEVTVGGTSTGETRPIGTEIAKANNNNNSSSYNYPNWWAKIGDGTRVEVRARIGGKRQGFNTFIRLLGNKGTWPANGQISLLENPVYLSDPNDDFVQQSMYFGSVSSHTGVSDTVYVNTSDWNIYWAEIVDGSIAKVGVNGYTTMTISSSDYSVSWSIGDKFHNCGMYLLIGPKPGDAILDEDGYTDDQIIAGDWADSEFMNISYEDSKTNDNSPHIDIDWVRVWRNDNYTELVPPFYNNCWFY